MVKIRFAKETRWTTELLAHLLNKHGSSVGGSRKLNLIIKLYFLMSSYFAEGANIPWSRDEISGCDCNEKTNRHVHCPCFACSGRATDRKTELLHWIGTCQLAATNFASVVTGDSDKDSHISYDRSFEYVGECDQPVEDKFGAGCNPEQRRDLQQSDKIDDDEAISIQNPMKK